MNIADLLEIGRDENKQILLCMVDDDEIKIPMTMQYYVADDIFFFEVDYKNNKRITTDDFIYFMEKEVEEDSCWSSNIYVAPMERVGECELRFAKNYEEVINNDRFDNCYDIIRVKEFDNAVVIYLRG